MVGLRGGAGAAPKGPAGSQESLPTVGIDRPPLLSHITVCCQTFIKPTAPVPLLILSEHTCTSRMYTYSLQHTVCSIYSGCAGFM